MEPDPLPLLPDLALFAAIARARSCSRAAVTMSISGGRRRLQVPGGSPAGVSGSGKIRRASSSAPNATTSRAREKKKPCA